MKKSGQVPGRTEWTQWIQKAVVLAAQRSHSQRRRRSAVLRFPGQEGSQ